MKVFVHVVCRSEETAFGSSLFLKTIRTGFPTSELFVILGDCVDSVAKTVAAESSRLNFRIIPGRDLYVAAPYEEHGALIRTIIETVGAAANDPVALCDSDVVFWDGVEDLRFSPTSLYAGRLSPEMTEMGCRMAARIHPSLFIVPNPRALLAAIEEKRKNRAYLRPFEAFTFQDGEETRMYDVLASLYNLLPDRAYCFEEKELDLYDHLFCGSLFDILGELGISKKNEGLIREAHKVAACDLSAFRGFWRRQAGLEGVAN